MRQACRKCSVLRLEAMLKFMRCLFLVGLFAVLVYGDDFTIPIPTGGSIIIQHPQFITKDQFNVTEPLLTFGVVDNSTAPWERVTLQFDMGGYCNGKIRQWSASLTLLSSAITTMAKQTIKTYEHRIDSLFSEV